MKTPLLPLNAIVCPKGRIPLQIFEPHYLDMVSECLKSGREFAVVLLCEEGLNDARFYKQGTLVRIVDFDNTPQAGVLSITVEGIAQVALNELEQQEDGLWLASIRKKSQESYVDLPEEFDDLKVVLKALVKHPFVKDLNMEIDYQDGREVSWRLTELLPLGNKQKQCLYEMQDAVSRLERISKELSEMVT